MNNITILTLKVFRRLYAKCFGYKYKQLPIMKEMDADKASDMIYDLLASDKPCMIARFGATELSCIRNYLSIKARDKNILKYIKGETFDWWWNPNIMAQMQNWSGFFPPTENKLEQFCEMMLGDAKKMDICGVFDAVIPMVDMIGDYLNSPAMLPLYTYNSFTAQQPWTRILKNKEVLVIHPFAELIERQYARRELLFSNPNVLPEFELKTIKAVQSIGGVSNGFTDWFEALDWMKKEMDTINYDICLIGCGAYGFPLAAYAKRMGKKAVHIGGGLQLLFGIKGKRWEDSRSATQWGLPADFYKKLFDNPAWVRPDEYRTANSEKVEGACYW